MSHSVTGNLTEKVGVCCVRLRLWHSSPDSRDMQISYPASLYKSSFITALPPALLLYVLYPPESLSLAEVVLLFSHPLIQILRVSTTPAPTSSILLIYNRTNFIFAMKANLIATTAMAAAVVSAQTTTAPASTTSTVTEYYNTCTSS